MGGQPGAEAVRAVIGQGQRVHRRHGAVLVHAAGDRAKAVESQTAQQQDQRPEQQPGPAGQGSDGRPRFPQQSPDHQRGQQKKTQEIDGVDHVLSRV